MKLDNVFFASLFEFIPDEKKKYFVELAYTLYPNMTKEMLHNTLIELIKYEISTGVYSACDVDYTDERSKFEWYEYYLSLNDEAKRLAS